MSPLRQVRVRRGVTQRQLQLRTGLDHSKISRAERDRYAIRLEEFGAIVRALRLSDEEIVRVVRHASDSFIEKQAA